MFKLYFTENAKGNLRELEQNKSLQKRFKSVRKTLGYLEKNPRHPDLKNHKYEFLSRDIGVQVFEAYAENHTPQAYRIFWRYEPQTKEITIIAITPHP